MSKVADLIDLPNYKEPTDENMLERTRYFYDFMKDRRTVRDYSDKKVPKKVIENCLLTAGLAPNGANLQPWNFVVVSDQAIKSKIRVEAEKEELAFYKGGKAPQEWLDALSHLGTDEHKPFLESAPYLIAIFAKSYELLPGGKKVKHYYVQESVGIATGMLITAIHNAGLVSLTHTPSPMGFLNDILDRPKNERAFLLLVVGFPAENAKVPNIEKKSIDEIAQFI